MAKRDAEQVDALNLIKNTQKLLLKFAKANDAKSLNIVIEEVLIYADDRKMSVTELEFGKKTLVFYRYTNRVRDFEEILQQPAGTMKFYDYYADELFAYFNDLPDILNKYNVDITPQLMNSLRNLLINFLAEYCYVYNYSYSVKEIKNFYTPMPVSQVKSFVKKMVDIVGTDCSIFLGFIFGLEKSIEVADMIFEVITNDIMSYSLLTKYANNIDNVYFELLKYVQPEGVCKHVVKELNIFSNRGINFKNNVEVYKLLEKHLANI